MHPIVRPALAVAVMGLILTGCSSSTGTSASSTAASGWSTPDEVLAGVKAAGFDCTLPSSDTQPQILTKDPFTGEDLGGHALIRCADFQVMLAKDSVDDGFATLVKCQTVPQSIRESKEWTVPVVEGDNFLVLPANLTTGWAAGAEPKDLVEKLGGTESTFGEIYDRSCAGRNTAGSTEPSAGPSASAS
jgi:hypothetical protein